jgi:deoxyribose-phosphate aldolase
MEREELIEQITREVAQRIRGAAGGGIASGAGSAVAASHGGSHRAAPSVLTEGEIARYIDHTLLKPDAKPVDIDKLCIEAMEHRFYSVCVNGCWAERCARALRGTGVKVAVVVGFPLGAMTGYVKGLEARRAIEDGADEIDMVINVGALKSGELAMVRDDILAVTRVTGSRRICKVILETVLLSDEEKLLACRLAEDAGADFVKTSTGFAGGGATLHDVALMRRAVGNRLQVKASGGIRNTQDAVAMIEAGADRLGTSASVAIVTGGSGAGAY